GAGPRLDRYRDRCRALGAQAQLPRDDAGRSRGAGGRREHARRGRLCDGRRRRAAQGGGRSKKPPGPGGGLTDADWAGLIARVCANTGWTPSYVREHVDLPTVAALDEEWRLRPPVHLLVAAYLDYKPRDNRGATQAD